MGEGTADQKHFLQRFVGKDVCGSETVQLRLGLEPTFF